MAAAAACPGHQIPGSPFETPGLTGQAQFDANGNLLVAMSRTGTVMADAGSWGMNVVSVAASGTLSPFGSSPFLTHYVGNCPSACPYASDAAISRDGHFVALGTNGPTHMYKVQGGNLTKVVGPLVASGGLDTSSGQSVAFRPGGGFLATANYVGGVALYEINDETGALGAQVNRVLVGRNVTGIAFDTDGDRLVVSTQKDGLFVLGVSSEGVLSFTSGFGVDPHGVAHEEHRGHPVAFVRCVVDDAKRWGTLMQTFRAEQYLGKRVRLSAFVRCIDCDGSASLWMRVDRGGAPIAFDNMHDRAVSGTTTWRRLEIVLDVAEDSDTIAFGTILDGGGGVRVSEFRFEVVGNAVPTTAPPPPLSPVNLDFSGADDGSEPGRRPIS